VESLASESGTDSGAGRGLEFQIANIAKIAGIAKSEKWLWFAHFAQIRVSFFDPRSSA
jgi:hypothetical protein